MSTSESPYVWFDGSSPTNPKPVGKMRATGRRIVVRTEPNVTVDGDRVGVVQFGPAAKWMRREFDGFVRPPDSDAVRFIHVGDVPGLVRYCTACNVDIVVNRKFWNYAELVQ